jgi:hypothetical protein
MALVVMVIISGVVRVSAAGAELDAVGGLAARLASARRTLPRAPPNSRAAATAAAAKVTRLLPPPPPLPLQAVVSPPRPCSATVVCLLLALQDQLAERPKGVVDADAGHRRGLKVGQLKLLAQLSGTLVWHRAP